MFRPICQCGLIVVLLRLPLPAQEIKPSHDPRLFPSPEQQRAYAAVLEELLELHQNPSTAERQYQLAKGQNAKDPRADYAMGLVMLKHFEYDEAGKCFQAATKGERIQFLPAWQARIHLDLLQKDREEFLRDTLELAKLVAKPNAEWIGTDQPLRAATWLGQVFEYLKLPGVDFLEPAQQTAQVEKLTELLTSRTSRGLGRGPTETSAKVRPRVQRHPKAKTGNETGTRTDCEPQDRGAVRPQART